MRLTDTCTLPRDEGRCADKQSRWYFDQSENRCMPFYYTGCGGNKNNFESRDACESDCPPKIGKTLSLCLQNSILALHAVSCQIYCISERNCFFSMDLDIRMIV